MGMTDRQFDEYLKGLLRELKRIQRSLSEKGVIDQDLEKLIQDTEDGLKRP